MKSSSLSWTGSSSSSSLNWTGSSSCLTSFCFSITNVIVLLVICAFDYSLNDYWKITVMWFVKFWDSLQILDLRYEENIMTSLSNSASFAIIWISVYLSSLSEINIFALLIFILVLKNFQRSALNLSYYLHFHDELHSQSILSVILKFILLLLIILNLENISQKKLNLIYKNII